MSFPWATLISQIQNPPKKKYIKLKQQFIQTEASNEHNIWNFFEFQIFIFFVFMYLLLFLLIHIRGIRPENEIRKWRPKSRWNVALENRRSAEPPPPHHHNRLDKTQNRKPKTEKTQDLCAFNACPGPGGGSTTEPYALGCPTN